MHTRTRTHQWSKCGGRLKTCEESLCMSGLNFLYPLCHPPPPTPDFSDASSYVSVLVFELPANTSQVQRSGRRSKKLSLLLAMRAHTHNGQCDSLTCTSKNNFRDNEEQSCRLQKTQESRLQMPDLRGWAARAVQMPRCHCRSVPTVEWLHSPAVGESQ